MWVERNQAERYARTVDKFVGFFLLALIVIMVRIVVVFGGGVGDVAEVIWK